jgi:hypothetical protein
VFGIMKRRHRILKLPFELHDALDIDAVFFTCAALHNMLLRVDGRADIGANYDDWIEADIDKDDYRIRRDGGGVALFKLVPQCTSVPVYKCTSAPVPKCTGVPVYQCTSVPPVYQCTSVPVY